METITLSLSKEQIKSLKQLSEKAGESAEDYPLLAQSLLNEAISCSS